VYVKYYIYICKMKPKVYTLKDFNFKPHSLVKGATQGILILPNGITVSIVGGGRGLHGDGVDTFEVAAWKSDTKDWIKLSDHDDVRGYVDEDELLFLLFELSQKKV
jgi:hypothetical protein